MNDKSIKRFNLTQKGVKYALLKTFYNKKIVINFQFSDNFFFQGKTFSEITLLNFVAKSYANSCLTLFKKLTEYNPGELDNNKSTQKIEIPLFQFDKIKDFIQNIKKVYDEIELKF